jgi:hypothetical protein
MGTCIVCILLLAVTTILIPEAFAQQMITIGLSSASYYLGKPVMMQGILNLGPTDPKGLPVSIEIYDSRGNVIDAQTIPISNNQFSYAFPTGDGTKITTGGAYTIIAYYGSPNPMLLNTPQSTKVTFIVNVPTAPSGTTSTQTTQQLPSQSSPYNPLTSSSLSGNTPLFIAIVIILLGSIAIFGRSRRRDRASSNVSADISVNNPRRPFTEEQKSFARHRQNGRCLRCGQFPSVWEYHHRDGDRSNNNTSNCEAICPTCHAKVERGLD